MVESKTDVFHPWIAHDSHDLWLYEHLRQLSKVTHTTPQPITPTVATSTQFDVVDFSAGFIAGCAGVVVGHPFDTIKVRQQTLGSDYSTMRKCVRNTVTKEGFLGFYKGLLFPLAAQGVLNCMFFGVYERVKGDKSASYPQIALAGAVGGAAQSALASPIELVKIKMQNQTANNHRVYKSPVHCLTTIVKRHGPTSLTRGLPSTTVRDSIGFSIYMTAFEYMCRLCHPEGSEGCSVAQLLLTGGLSGNMSWLVTYCIDTSKSRIQGDRLDQPKYRSLVQSFLLIAKEEGPRALFKGLPALFLRSFFLNAVTLTMYACCKQYLTGAGTDQLAYE